MKTFKEIWIDMHDDLPELAHDVFLWMIHKYGRNSEEVNELRREEEKKPS